MNERKLLQAIVAKWLVERVPVDADEAANEILDWECYGNEEMTRSLVDHGFLRWDNSTAPEWMIENVDRWVMVAPTVLGIFEAIS